MTLEKLLIFGFALAAVGALTLMGTGITEDRAEEIGPYKQTITDLVEKAK